MHPRRCCGRPGSRSSMCRRGICAAVLPAPTTCCRRSCPPACAIARRPTSTVLRRRSSPPATSAACNSWTARSMHRSCIRSNCWTGRPADRCRRGSRKGDGMSERWRALGPIDELKQKPLRQVVIDKVAIALSFRDGRFGAISGRCNHVGGPLGEGVLSDEGYIVCPWHHWMFHRESGEAHRGIPAIVPRHDLREENGVLYVNLDAATKRVQAPHPPHPLTRKEDRKPGKLRLLGLSTTAMDEAYPRYSTSDDLLQVALAAR